MEYGDGILRNGSLKYLNLVFSMHVSHLVLRAWFSGVQWDKSRGSRDTAEQK